MLHRLLEDAAARYPDRIAVEDPGRGDEITYRELNELADRVRDDLLRHGIRKSERVGICTGKSISTLISIFGILKAEAAYVPVAVDAPGARIQQVLSDCSATALFAEGDVLRRLPAGPDRWTARDCTALSSRGDAPALAWVKHEGNSMPVGVPEDLAYILYTSGSTGQPKGVMHSHRSAASFIDWCSETFEPTSQDRFSSHAPFQFDLSIFDVYVCFKHGATLVLIGDQTGKQPRHLAPLIAEQRISIWYSTPSVLRILVEYGRLERYDYSSLRMVLFAGEVFPQRYLRMLMGLWPNRRYFNLYGPTETNVCTFYEIEAEPPEGAAGPPSIGRPCRGTRTRVVTRDGRPVGPGERGELLVSGGTVMLGYWNRSGLEADAFHVDEEGRRWYRTGDLVRETPGGEYLFLGRRDRMVKRRGFRIELGEIECLLYRIPSVTEAAVVALTDRDDNVVIRAFLVWAGDETPALVDLKRLCAENMSPHLVPDRFSILESVPKTSTNKIDYQALLRLR